MWLNTVYLLNGLNFLVIRHFSGSLQNACLNEELKGLLCYQNSTFFQLQGATPPDPDQGLCLWTPLGAPPPDPRYRLALRARHVVPHCSENSPLLGSSTFLQLLSVFHSRFSFFFPCRACLMHLGRAIDNTVDVYTSIKSPSQVSTTKKDSYLRIYMAVARTRPV